eukprot:CAMPEP_0115003760 /NCGR_PEP_ID=MMETSP0216-20121206/18807_1 /TAXON_ID=223996 /ORGANISM="Protocruzia adherens, Strain Boccale" /LENGTH=59 /DNA_ID=CAMNT_0002369635 /DNA_START=38 /DNA_END=214 /DNA_ORIENTATION=+
MSKPKTLICDTGTGFMKVGWAGDEFPAYNFPTLVGRPMLRHEERIDSVELKSIMVGDEA